MVQDSKLRNQSPISRIHRVNVESEIRIGFEFHSNGEASIEKLFKYFESVGHGINGLGESRIQDGLGTKGR